jgi:hypothetical protein
MLPSVAAPTVQGNQHTVRRRSGRSLIARSPPRQKQVVIHRETPNDWWTGLHNICATRAAGSSVFQFRPQVTWTPKPAALARRRFRGYRDKRSIQRAGSAPCPHPPLTISGYCKRHMAQDLHSGRPAGGLLVDRCVSRTPIAATASGSDISVVMGACHSAQIERDREYEVCPIVGSGRAD